MAVGLVAAFDLQEDVLRRLRARRAAGAGVRGGGAGAGAGGREPLGAPGRAEPFILGGSGAQTSPEGVGSRWPLPTCEG